MENWRSRAKSAMQKKGITQEELAERVTMAQPTVSAKLNGRRDITLEELNQFADAIGVSRVWLTHGEQLTSSEYTTGDGRGDNSSLGIREPSAGYVADTRGIVLRFDVLRYVIEGVEEWLQGHNKQLSPPKKAELILVLYEYVLKHGAEKKAIDAIINLAA